MTLSAFYKIYDSGINKAIFDALREDKISNDVTTNLLLKGSKGDRKMSAVLLCKEDCILAGIEIFKKVYRQIDKKAAFKTYYKDGAILKKGTKVLEVRSTLRNLLMGERTALNFLQRMSGIATLTGRFVRKLKFKDSKILHTRKTTPNFRLFETAAVKTGGGDFHRLSLASSVMIKDNHIEAAGSIEKVLLQLKKTPPSPKLKQKFEIEVRTFEEIRSVIRLGKGLVRVVMLDNFKPGGIDKVIKLLKYHGFKIEVSGGVNPGNFAKYQKRGIDFYSIGMLTHSYRSCDFSLEF